MTKDCTPKEIADLIKGYRKVAIFSHMRPDGDAYGSSLALSCALNELGIENTVCNESDIPNNLAFVEGTKNIKKTLNEDVEAIITVDCSDEMRLGLLADTYLKLSSKMPTFNIDHHVSNTHYAKYNLVKNCSANCMNVYDIIEAMGVKLNPEISQYLMLGLITDSGNFSHDDVEEKTFTIAGKLVKNGAKVNYLNDKLFKNQPKTRAQLYTHTMSRIRYSLNDKLAIITVLQNDFREFNADQSMTEGFVDFPLTIDTVEVSASIMEIKSGQFKISLRSKLYADVNKIAGVYGGGGHVRAAGCMLFGDIEDVIDRLTYTVSQYL